MCTWFVRLYEVPSPPFVFRAHAKSHGNTNKSSPVHAFAWHKPACHVSPWLRTVRTTCAYQITGSTAYKFRRPSALLRDFFPISSHSYSIGTPSLLRDPHSLTDHRVWFSSCPRSSLRLNPLHISRPRTFSHDICEDAPHLTRCASGSGPSPDAHLIKHRSLMVASSSLYCTAFALRGGKRWRPLRYSLGFFACATPTQFFARCVRFRRGSD